MKVFWKESYEVIIPVNDIIIEIFSRDSNYIIDVVMRPKLGNSSVSVTEVIITAALEGFGQNDSLCLKVNFGSNSIIWNWH